MNALHKMTSSWLFWYILSCAVSTFTCSFVIPYENKLNHLGGSSSFFQTELQVFPSFPKLKTTFSPVQEDTVSSSRTTQQQQVPYVIDRISSQARDEIFKEISFMCINVFFNNDKDKSIRNPPWKNAQLGYLKNLQMADLRQRKNGGRQVNDMFVARRVISIPSTEVAQEQPLILDTSSIYNFVPALGKDDGDVEYIRGELLGFVEITEKQYGLVAPPQQKGPQNDDDNMMDEQSSSLQMRPVLTNLSVRKEVRNSGIGGKLMESCEDAVLRDWDTPQKEIILEVEDDNPSAIEFYKKRGYEISFCNPASRRYSVNGFFLKKERCTKIVMQKILNANNSMPTAGILKEKVNFTSIFQKVKENVFQTT